MNGTKHRNSVKNKLTASANVGKSDIKPIYVRKGFSKAERVDYMKRLLNIEKAKAEERKRGGTNLVENSPEGNSRRNIGAGTRIILAKKLEPWLREQARAKQSAAGGDKRSEGAKTAFINVDKSDQKEFSEPIHVQKRIADAAKVSTGTLAKFDKVERELRAGK